MRLVVAALIGWAMMVAPAPARGPDDDGFDVWSGSCSAESYAVDAARAPYPCNALIHVAFPGQPGHEQLIFVIKGDGGKQNGTMLSLGGMIDAKGDLQVEHIQFKPGEGVETAPGSACAITREGQTFKHSRCSAAASDGSGRSVALDFAVAGKMAMNRQ
jgi:hypothetical protein